MTEGFPPNVLGGPDISSYYLARALSKNCEVSILARAKKGQFVTEEIKNNITIFRDPSLNFRGHGHAYFDDLRLLRYYRAVKRIFNLDISFLVSNLIQVFVSPETFSLNVTSILKIPALF